LTLILPRGWPVDRWSSSHDETIIRRLRKGPQFAAEYSKTALEDEDGPRVLLITLRQSRKLAVSPEKQKLPAWNAKASVAPCPLGAIPGCPH